MNMDDLPRIPDNLPIGKWKANWDMDDDILRCTECRAHQLADLSNTDFVHMVTCSRRGPGQRPWEDLFYFVTDPKYRWVDPLVTDD